MSASSNNAAPSAVSHAQIGNINTTLHLRGSQTPEQITPIEPNTKKSRVRWEEGTVDNEFMDKKKSKVCCIFHPQRNFDESDDECSCGSSSSSSSSSDSDSDNENTPNDPKKRKKKPLKKLPSPNSYEVQPDYTKKSEHKHHHNEKIPEQNQPKRDGSIRENAS